MAGYPILVHLPAAEQAHRVGAGWKLGQSSGGDRLTLSPGVLITPPKPQGPRPVSITTLLTPHQESSVSRSPSSRRGSVHSSSTDPITTSSTCSSGSEETSRHVTVDCIQGRVFRMAQSQASSRRLQLFLSEASTEDVTKVVEEVVPNAVALMLDGFGNYFMQRLVEVSGPLERATLMKAILPSAAKVANNAKGTRVLQKLITMTESASQIEGLCKALQGSILDLCYDPSGTHIIQSLLPRLSPTHQHYMHTLLADHLLELAYHRHGCLALQACFNENPPLGLAVKVMDHLVPLSQNAYSNYIIQHILARSPPLKDRVAEGILGSVASLSVNKFASNVVEKCLRTCSPPAQARIIEELLQSPKLRHVVSHPFGNYVIQTALEVARGEQEVNFKRAVGAIVARCPDTCSRKNMQVSLLQGFARLSSPQVAGCQVLG